MPDDISQHPKVDFSPLCQLVSRDGVTIRVQIYRVPAVGDRWSLEVIGEDETSTVWDGVFDTDEDALSTFEAALEAVGISGLTESVH